MATGWCHFGCKAFYQCVGTSVADGLPEGNGEKMMGKVKLKKSSQALPHLLAAQLKKGKLHTAVTGWSDDTGLLAGSWEESRLQPNVWRISHYFPRCSLVSLNSKSSCRW